MDIDSESCDHDDVGDHDVDSLRCRSEYHLFSLSFTQSDKQVVVRD